MPRRGRGTAVEDGVGVGDEELDPRLAEITVVARIEGALGQPDAARRAAEVLEVVGAGNLDLGPLRRLVRHQRQIAVGRAAGDDLEIPRVLQLTEPADDVAPILPIEDVEAFAKVALVESSAAG
jgi:hypothetical protein